MDAVNQPERKFTPEFWSWGLVLAMAGLFVWNNLQWDQRSYPFWIFTSSPNHLHESYRLAELFLHTGFLGLPKALLVPWSYPPLVYLVSLPFYLLLGASFETAVLSQGVFILALAFSLYATGRKLWNRWAGLLLVFLALSFPGVQSLGKYYMLDLPLASMVSLCFYLYLQSEHFTRRGYALGFGLAFLLGFLTRYQMVFYLAGLFLYEMIYWIIKGKARGWWVLTFAILLSNLGLSLWALRQGWSLPVISLSALGLWYMVCRRADPSNRGAIFNLGLAYWVFLLPALGCMHLSWPQIAGNWQYNFHFRQVGIFQGLTRLHFGWLYLFMLPGKFALGWGMFIFLLAAVLFTLLGRELRKKTGLALLILAAGYIFLSSAPVIRPRFFLPFLPFCGLLITGMLVSLKNRWVKGGLLALALLAGFSQWFGWWFPRVFPPVGENPSYSDYVEPIFDRPDTAGIRGIADLLPRHGIGRSLFGTLPPWREDWKIEAVMDDIFRDPHRPAGRALKVRFYAEVPFKQNNFALFEDIFNTIIFLKYPRERFVSRSGDFDYLIAVGGFRPAIQGLKLVKTYRLPQNGKIFLWRYSGEFQK